MNIHGHSLKRHFLLVELVSDMTLMPNKDVHWL